MTTPSYSERYNYVYFTTAQHQRFCHRTYTSSSRRPKISVIGSTGLTAGDCPAGFTYRTKDELDGVVNGTIHVFITSAGAYIGYLESGAIESEPYEKDSGWFWHEASDQNDGWCWRVTGVDEEPATANGTFPILLGLNDSVDCPAGLEPQGHRGHRRSQWLVLHVGD